MDIYAVVMDPRNPEYDLRIKEMNIMLASADVTISSNDNGKILEAFIIALEKIVYERKKKNYNWAAWRVSKRIIYDTLSIFWSTYTLGDTFFQCFLNIRNYLYDLRTYENKQLIPGDLKGCGDISLKLVTIFFANNYFNLDYINFDGVFVTGGIDQRQEDKILLDSGIILDGDTFPGLEIKDNVDQVDLADLSRLGIELESIAGHDLVLTQERIRAVIDNLNCFNDPDNGPDALIRCIQAKFKVDLDPIEIPLPNSSSYVTLLAQKTTLERSLKDLKDGPQKKAIRDKLDELTSYVSQLKYAGANQETESMLKQMLDFLRLVDIPVKIDLISASQVLLSRGVDFEEVKASYITQLKNKVTTTSQKVLFAIQIREGYKLEGDYSVLLGKYLIDTGTNILNLKTKNKTNFSFLVATARQEELTQEALYEKVKAKNVDFTLALRQPQVQKFIQGAVESSVSSFIAGLGLVGSVASQMALSVTSGITNQLFSYIPFRNKTDLSTQTNVEEEATVPASKSLLSSTVPASKSLLSSTVPAGKKNWSDLWIIGGVANYISNKYSNFSIKQSWGDLKGFASEISKKYNTNGGIKAALELFITKTWKWLLGIVGLIAAVLYFLPFINLVSIGILGSIMTIASIKTAGIVVGAGAVAVAYYKKKGKNSSTSNNKKNETWWYNRWWNSILNFFSGIFKGKNDKSSSSKQIPYVDESSLSEQPPEQIPYVDKSSSSGQPPEQIPYVDKSSSSDQEINLGESLFYAK